MYITYAGFIVFNQLISTVSFIQSEIMINKNSNRKVAQNKHLILHQKQTDKQIDKS